MKNLFVLLLLSSFAIGQELPMKNDMVYYSFEHKMSNKKSCLMNLYSLALKDVMFNINSINMNKQKKWDLKQHPTIIMPPPKLSGSCTDSSLALAKDLQFVLMRIEVPVEYYGTSILNLGKKKLRYLEIQAYVYLETTDFSEYELTFKKFDYVVSFQEGFAMRQETHPI